MTRPTNAILQLTVPLLAVTVLLAGGGQAEAKDSCLTFSGGYFAIHTNRALPQGSGAHGTPEPPHTQEASDDRS
jgi:hypothetical protein